MDPTTAAEWTIADVLSLIIAGVALLISVMAFGWQVAQHLLDGGRVRIELLPCIWEPGVSIQTMRNARGPVTWIHGERAGFECAQLVVENAGRTPVTIHTPGISFLGERVRRGPRRLRRQLRSVTPRTYSDSFNGERSATESVMRLEPYSRVVVLFDIWSAIDHARNILGPKRTVKLRGSVSVAGKKRLRLMPRRSAWRIPPGVVSLTNDGRRIAAEQVILQQLVADHWDNREGTMRDGFEYPLAVARTVAEELVLALDDLTANRVKEAIRAALAELSFGEDVPPVPVSVTSFTIHERLEDLADAVNWTEARQRRESREQRASKSAAAPEEATSEN